MISEFDFIAQKKRIEESLRIINVRMRVLKGELKKKNKKLKVNNGGLKLLFQR
jgi:hypothetical protein